MQSESKTAQYCLICGGMAPCEMHTFRDTVAEQARDRVSTVRARLADGRSVSDFDVLCLLDEIGRLRSALLRIRDGGAPAEFEIIARMALSGDVHG